MAFGIVMDMMRRNNGNLKMRRRNGFLNEDQVSKKSKVFIRKFSDKEKKNWKEKLDHKIKTERNHKVGMLAFVISLALIILIIYIDCF